MAKNARSEHSWERQPGESVQAFEAFDLYCKMGEERSVRAVGQRLDKSRTQIGKWSSRWNWVSRARDYDNEIKRQEAKKERTAYREMQRRQIGLAVQLQKKALEALKNLSIEDMSPKDIKEFIKLGAALEQANMNRAVLEQGSSSDDDTTIDIYLPEKDGDNGE